MLAQDHALIEHENAEQDPEIEKEKEKSAELVGGFGRQRAHAVSVGSGRDDVVCACWIRCHRSASQTIMELSPKIHLYGCLAPFFDFAFLPFSLVALEAVPGPSSSSLVRKSATRASVTRRAQ